MTALLLAPLLAAAAGAAVVTNPVPAPIAPGITLRLTPFGQSLPAPGTQFDGFRTHIHALKPVPDASGRLFIVDTRGTISVASTAGGTPRLWFDIRIAVPSFRAWATNGQAGLMSFAFHPNFAGNPGTPGYGIFYTIDTSADTAGTATLAGKGPGINHHNVIHEFRVVDPAAATASLTAQREVLRIAQPRGDHGAGNIAFNPTAAPGSADYGKLYISLGDGGGGGDPSGNAQDFTSPFGKILRIDPTPGAGGAAYTIPADNGFAGDPAKLGEIWAAGLRNPQHFSWDAATGQMLIADMGQSQLEEVNIGVAGSNYGWPLREGSFARGTSADPDVYDTPAKPGGFLDPVAQFDHEELLRSGEYTLGGISSVFAYTGTAIPELVGKVVVSELVSGRLLYYDKRAALLNQPAPFLEIHISKDGRDTNLRSLDGNPLRRQRVDLRLGTDNAGELYLFSKTYGNIYKLGALSALPKPAPGSPCLSTSASPASPCAAPPTRPPAHARQ
ncbi:PQQ-dependent sugar dehydrogenase [Sandarakinorhabdus sp.]|uniref:PQQ-dependent sugar dehydrogenase n=1 Tax=Sandarakinorhabdus sp. TaxID=1916663 RepID=UPI00333E2AC4